MINLRNIELRLQLLIINIAITTTITACSFTLRNTAHEESDDDGSAPTEATRLGAMILHESILCAL